MSLLVPLGDGHIQPLEVAVELLEHACAGIEVVDDLRRRRSATARPPRARSPILATIAGESVGGFSERSEYTWADCVSAHCAIRLVKALLSTWEWNSSGPITCLRE